jgi:hypothetical protein
LAVVFLSGIPLAAKQFLKPVIFPADGGVKGMPQYVCGAPCKNGFFRQEW